MASNKQCEYIRIQRDHYERCLENLETMVLAQMTAKHAADNFKRDLNDMVAHANGSDDGKE